MDMIDTTKDLGRGMLGMYQRFDHVRIGGYIQPQWQTIETQGGKNFDGGDFAPDADNRFMIRRGRIKFEYARFNETNQPSVHFVFQFDGTERGVFIRDFWGRYYENKYQLFSITAGMFARPFGYELNLGSPDRESPERGRMSQILMKTERDLGAMISFEPRKKNHPLRNIKLDIGLFNGQGLTATTDYDNYKDLIARLSLKPITLGKKLFLSAGISYLNGGWLQKNAVRYEVVNTTNGKDFVPLAGDYTNKKAPRKYYGGDAQLKLKTKAGFTELRAEYWAGTQSATASTTETPATLLTEPIYIRKFDGAYFYLLSNVFNPHHQLGIKLDWYDPNTQLNAADIGKNNSISSTNIKYTTLGFGYINYINENLKLLLWYEIVTNEKTNLALYTTDIKDNIFTCRMQFRF
jgi:hypothetical protein